MERILEYLMLFAFLTAICHLLYLLAHNTVNNRSFSRGIAITMGIGFFFGAASKVTSQPLEGTFYLYVLGIVLSYSTFLFTLPISKMDQ